MFNLLLIVSLTNYAGDEGRFVVKYSEECSKVFNLEESKGIIEDLVSCYEEEIFRFGLIRLKRKKVKNHHNCFYLHSNINFKPFTFYSK